MPTNYKINGMDIENIFESFTLAEQQEGGVTDSKFSDGSGRFQQNGADLKTALGKTFPTSAGTYLGGFNSTSDYKAQGLPIDVALPGCRPIGCLRATLTPGTYYINRVNNQTWVSSSANSASGTRIDHDPKYLFLELQGGGGGGGGGGAFYASGGGGGGGYCFLAVTLPENSYYRIVVGSGGNGGDGGTNHDGGTGGETAIYDASGTQIARGAGGYGGPHNEDYTPQGGGAFGGIVNMTGGQGGSKEHGGSGVGAFTVTLPKPEQTQWSRGNFSGGSSNGNNYGGGGGASAFANGGVGGRDNAGAGTLGSGGGGGGYRVAGDPGARGGDGFAKIYY